jgi:anti-anti-sigma factor
MMNAVHRAGVTVFEPGSSLTVENAHELLKLLHSHTTSTVPNIVVNMHQTQVLDSTGIGALVTSMRYVRHLKGGFAVSNLSPELDRMLSLMNLHRTLDIFDSEDIAAEHLATRPRL